jgi:hypothetical protein
MDFIMGLSITQSGYDSIWSIMDRLLWDATSRVVFVEDSLSARSAKEDCV